MTVVFCFALQRQAGFSQNQPIGFVLPDTKGEDVSLDKYSGKKAIVVFWSSENPASVDELENLRKISQNSDVILIGINIEHNTAVETIDLIIDSKAWNFEILLDPNMKFFKSIFKENIIPSTLIINAKHEIIEQKQGYIPGDDEWILSRISEI